MKPNADYNDKDVEEHQEVSGFKESRQEGYPDHGQAVADPGNAVVDEEVAFEVLRVVC